MMQGREQQLSSAFGILESQRALVGNVGKTPHNGKQEVKRSPLRRRPKNSFRAQYEVQPRLVFLLFLCLLLHRHRSFPSVSSFPCKGTKGPRLLSLRAALLVRWCGGKVLLSITKSGSPGVNGSWDENFVEKSEPIRQDQIYRRVRRGRRGNLGIIMFVW